MDGGIGELPRLASGLEGNQLLLRFQQFFAGVLLRQPLTQDGQIRHGQLMVTTSGLGFQGVA